MEKPRSAQVMEPQFFVFSPTVLLHPYISHYWLGLNSTGSDYPIIPDGSVDLVIRLDGHQLESRLYGTTTRRTDITVQLNNHYLGIRFKPGQSRHFMTASAHELTDCAESTEGLLKLSLSGLEDYFTPTGIAAYLDDAFCDYLAKKPPTTQQIDAAIRSIQHHNGQISVDEAAAVSCKSRRQFERIFFQAVGLSPKSYAGIRRFQLACSLITDSGFTLSRAAHEAGYTDQSHMSRVFKQLTGNPPARFIRDYGAFVQYPS